MTVRINSKGSFKKTNAFLDRLLGGDIYRNLDKYGRRGVDALASATPIDSGETANSWDYEIIKGKNPGIRWFNTHTNQGANIAILIQYGHGTGTGGYVAGYDYINPAIKPIFDKIADEVWKEVTRG